MIAIPMDMLMMAVAIVGGIAIISRTMLAGWRDWINLQRDRLVMLPRSDGAVTVTERDDQAAPDLRDRTAAVTRIEMADLRERLRKLEAIAAGVDL